MPPVTSTARWWCRMAARTCAVPVRKICCNGPTRNGRSNAKRERKLERARQSSPGSMSYAVVTAFPKKLFPVIHRSRDDMCRSHLPVTILREPDLVMSVRLILTALVASCVVCGAASLAQAQSAAPKPAKGAAKPAATKPEVAKPEAAKPDARPAAAVAGSAEPTLIGQYG